MKFPYARPVAALAASLTLASCGGGGKATFPITVTVRNLTESGLVLSTNGMDLVFTPNNPVSDITKSFPNEIEYGQAYNVLPKGYAVPSGSATGSVGSQPEHQTCSPSTTYPTNFLPSGTAGQLAKIQIYYDCIAKTYALTGTVNGLTADGLTLTDGSNGPVTVPANATSFAMTPVPFNQSFGVSVLTQPTGLVCKVTGGNGSQNNGSGIMNETATLAGGVTNLDVTCVPKT